MKRLSILIISLLLVFAVSLAFAGDKHGVYIGAGYGQETGALGVSIELEGDEIGIGAGVGMTAYPYSGSTMAWEVFGKYYFPVKGAAGKPYIAVGYGVVGTYQTYDYYSGSSYDEGTLNGFWAELGAQYFLNNSNFGSFGAIGLAHASNGSTDSGSSTFFTFSIGLGYLFATY